MSTVCQCDCGLLSCCKLSLLNESFDSIPFYTLLPTLAVVSATLCYVPLNHASWCKCCISVAALLSLLITAGDKFVISLSVIKMVNCTIVLPLLLHVLYFLETAVCFFFAFGLSIRN